MKEIVQKDKPPVKGGVVSIGFTDIISGVIKYDECCNQSDHTNHGCDDGGFGWIKHVRDI